MGVGPSLLISTEWKRGLGPPNPYNVPIQPLFSAETSWHLGEWLELGLGSRVRRMVLVSPMDHAPALSSQLILALFLVLLPPNFPLSSLGRP